MPHVSAKSMSYKFQVTVYKVINWKSETLTNTVAKNPYIIVLTTSIMHLTPQKITPITPPTAHKNNKS